VLPAGLVDKSEWAASASNGTRRQVEDVDRCSQHDPWAGRRRRQVLPARLVDKSEWAASASNGTRRQVGVGSKTQGASRCPSHGDAPSSAALTCTLRSPSHPTTATLWSGSALWSLAQALIACTITASWHLRRGTDRRSCRSLTWSPVLSSGCSIARSSPLGAGFSRFLEGMADSTPVNNALLCRPTVYFNALLYMAALKINALLRTLHP